jgi:hypothetical protein
MSGQQALHKRTSELPFETIDGNINKIPGRAAAAGYRKTSAKGIVNGDPSEIEFHPWMLALQVPRLQDFSFTREKRFRQTGSDRYVLMYHISNTWESISPSPIACNHKRRLDNDIPDHTHQMVARVLFLLICN